MKKFKALFLSLALCLTFATALTAVGCKGCGDDGEDSSSVTTDSSADSTIDFGAEDSPVALKFAQGQVEVNQYETVALALTVKGTSKAVTYASSDETVATVDESGVVTAKDKVGSVTVTATVDGISATCIVNVTKSPYVPELVIDQRDYTIEDGDVLKFSVETEWNKSVLSEDIAYAVSFAEDSLSAKASIAVSGNEITVTSAGVESFNVIVSATVRGIYTSKNVSVNVVEAQLKIQPVSAEFIPTAGGFKTSLATTDQIASAYANSCTLDFVVSKGSQLFEDVAIDWTASGNLVQLNGNTVVGQKRGTAEVTGTATVGGEIAKVKVVCDVIPPEVHLDETAVFDVSELSQYVVQSELLGTATDAEFHGEVVTASARGNRLMFDKTLFPKKASLLGEQQLVINTELVRYTMDVEVYTKIIKDADGFRQMKELAATDDTEWSVRFGEEKNSQFYDGYFVLGNDIAFNDVIESFTNTGTVWGVQGNEKDFTRGFKGVFDGKGYTVDGVESCSNGYNQTQSGGIFGYLATGGVIKNVTFTNAVLRGLNGFICAYGDGLIENVVVSYKKIGGDVKTTDFATASDYRAMATFFSRGAGNNATVKNCIVDASMAEVVYETAIYSSAERCDVHLFGPATNVIDSYVLSPDAKLLEHAGGGTKLSGFAELSEKATIFNEYDETLWTLVNGVPMLSGLANSFDKNAPIAFVATKDTLIADFTMSVRLDSPYVEVEVSDVAGVSYANGILTATEEAKGQQVTLTAKSLLNPGVQATHVVTIDWLGERVAVPTGEIKTVLHTNPVVEIGDNSWLGTENYAYVGDKLIGSGATLKLDLDAYGWDNWGEEDVTIVMVKDGNKTRFDVTLDIAYDDTVMESAETVASSFFKETDSAWTKILKDESYVPADTDKAEGFASVTKFDAKTETTHGNANAELWNKKNVDLGASLHYRDTDLSEYREVWFAIKTEICTLNVYPGYARLNTTEWVYFHLTQTGDQLWMIEINSADGAYSYKMENQTSGGGAGLTEGTLAALFYNGWATATAYEDGFGIRFITPDLATFDAPTIYTTEILGVKKN